MPLLTAGYYPPTYWAENYWSDGYWPNRGDADPTPFPLCITISYGGCRTVHQPCATLRIWAAIVDPYKVAVDSPTVTISIKRPDRSIDITDVAMTNSVLGSYYYDYSIAIDEGVYIVAIKATGSESRVTIEPSTFFVSSP